MDKKTREKYLVYGLACLIFCVAMWFIFAPSAKEKEAGLEGAGLNSELPDGKAKALSESKSEAYENNAEEGKKMGTLADYYLDDLSKGKSEQVQTSSFSSEEVSNARKGISEFESQRISNARYDDLAEEYARKTAEVERLRQQKRESIHTEKVDAKEIMEESYRLAAKYGQDAEKRQNEAVSNEEKKQEFELTAKVDKDAVSTLSENLELDMPYNFGFNTAVGTGYQSGKNTIRACIHEDQTITDGQRVKLRLKEPLQAGQVIIPKGQVISGVARFQKERMDILVNSVEYAGNIIPVAMMVYDTDGASGIYCPGSQELSAVKDAAASVGSGMGTSLSFAKSAGQQIAMDLTRGVMSGGSQYLSKKLRTVTVTMKQNYEVLLLPKK